MRNESLSAIQGDVVDLERDALIGMWIAHVPDVQRNGADSPTALDGRSRERLARIRENARRLCVVSEGFVFPATGVGGALLRCAQVDRGCPPAVTSPHWKSPSGWPAISASSFGHSDKEPSCK